MALNRARMAALRGEVHPKLLEVLHEQEEMIQGMRSLISDMGNQMNQIADLFGSQQTVLDKMKPYVARMKQLGIAAGSDPTITGELDG